MLGMSGARMANETMARTTAISAHDAPARIRANSVEHWARVLPDAVAVVEDERQWTWGQWNALADRLACGLSSLGIGPGDIVAVRTRVRFEWCLIDAAAAKLGCTLLCVNWRLTPPETAYILANGGARALVCDDEKPAALAEAWRGRPDMVAISIGNDTSGFLRFNDLLSATGPSRVSSSEAKLMIYTSGTTGLPKGVITDQPAAGAELLCEEYLADVTARGYQQPGDVVLVSVPLHHGVGAGLIHRAIEFGNRLILMRRYDPQAALTAIEAHRITFWFAVPTMFKRMATLPVTSLEQCDHSSIRSILTGTAPVSIETKRWVIDYFGPCLTEGYGSTETGMITYLLPHEQISRPGCSGQPYRHVAIKIVDAEGWLLERGKIGEILVRTPFAIRGYVGGTPLGPEARDDDGFFKMGDAGYLDEAGYLYITDRLKDMIISGGVNIYPAEIESVLLQHPDIVDVAIIGVPNDEFGEEVVGFFETRQGTSPSEEELLALCHASLASYKRPRRLTAVAELPRNTMGKVLKQQLRAPYWVGHERRV